MVYRVPVVQHPLRHLVNGAPCVPHIGGAVHQQAVAGGGAQRVDDDELSVGILLPQLLRRQKGVVDGAGLAGGEGDVQQVALLQQVLKKSMYAATLT